MNRCSPPSRATRSAPGPKHQMIGVAEDDVGARRAHLSGFIALTVAAVPTGMNAGVRISPRGMAIVPVRAAPSVAAIEKAKRVYRYSRLAGHWPRDDARSRQNGGRAPNVGLARRPDLPSLWRGGPPHAQWANDQVRREKARQLPHVLNALLGGAIVVGGAIGVGILRTPGIVAGELGQPALILLAWVAGGLLALLGANCFAEMATTMPEAGGPYVYTRRAFGPLGGIAIGWADWLTSVTSMATIAVAIAEYGIGAAGSPAATHLFAIAIIAAFTLLNWFGLEVVRAPSKC